MVWNEKVPSERRLPGQMTPGRTLARPTHVVCHITGTTSFESVRQTFTSSASAHYVIDPQGQIYQFVEENNQAWHAGIKPVVEVQYNKPASVWRKVLYHFSWAKYPANAIWLDNNLNPVPDRGSATFVGRPDGSEWPQYNYFIVRWGADAKPVNFHVSKRPNDYSVGIEILSLGAATPSPDAYSSAMYASLSELVTDICARYEIPRQKGRVVGHEDVNPIQRYGWDPNQGFDWSRVWN